MRKISQCSDQFEKELLTQGYRYIAGVDEVGRGCLAGPVVAAAVILDLTNFPSGLDDSKRLSPKKRLQLATELTSLVQGFAVKQVEADEIDQINIHQASLKAMIEAIQQLSPQPDYLLIDGFSLKTQPLPQKAIIKGDTLSVSIAAASIIAKVTRDRIMQDYEIQYPGYGFSRNVGYGTAEHLASLKRLGPTPIHRRSFRGVLPEMAQIELPWGADKPLDDDAKDE